MERSRRSGGLDNIIKKLQVNPSESSEKKKPQRTGSSRRKPAAVTRHVLSEPDENSEEDFVDEKPLKTVNNDSMSDDNTSTMEENGIAEENGVVEENGVADDKKEEDNVDIHLTDEGIPVLPDGTVVVQPEAVPDDKLYEPKLSSSMRSSYGVVDTGIVHCTSCGEQVNQNSKPHIKRHPTLHVLVCRRCHNYYTSDIITKDDEGTDEQCQWCGEGGKLLCCDFCTSTFCRACVKRNMGRGELSAIDDADSWKCYVCDLSPLQHLIDQCDQLFERLKYIQMKKPKEQRCGSASKTESENESLTEEVQRLAGDTRKVDHILRKKKKVPTATLR